MSNKQFMMLSIAFFMSFSTGLLVKAARSTTTTIEQRFRPKLPKIAFVPSSFRTGPLEVAKVFGRAKGCERATPELIQAVSDESVLHGIDPRIAAATLAIESSCNPYAVSVRGAVGLMQITPKTWSDKYDFTKTYNLLNLHDNVQVGISILADMIHTYGEREGVRRYQGLGVGCSTCDGAYTDKIMGLAVR